MKRLPGIWYLPRFGFLAGDTLAIYVRQRNETNRLRTWLYVNIEKRIQYSETRRNAYVFVNETKRLLAISTKRLLAKRSVAYSQTKRNGYFENETERFLRKRKELPERKRKPSAYFVNESKHLSVNQTQQLPGKKPGRIEKEKSSVC